MDPLITLWGAVVGSGLIGGLGRTMRDSYKRYVQGIPPWDMVDSIFDLFFGVFSSVTVWILLQAISPAESMDAVRAFALLVSAYAGADFIDGLLTNAGDMMNDMLEALKDKIKL